MRVSGTKVFKFHTISLRLFLFFFVYLYQTAPFNTADTRLMYIIQLQHRLMGNKNKPHAFLCTSMKDSIDYKFHVVVWNVVFLTDKSKGFCPFFRNKSKCCGTTSLYNQNVLGLIPPCLQIPVWVPLGRVRDVVRNPGPHGRIYIFFSLPQIVSCYAKRPNDLVQCHWLWRPLMSRKMTYTES